METKGISNGTAIFCAFLIALAIVGAAAVHSYISRSTGIQMRYALRPLPNREVDYLFDPVTGDAWMSDGTKRNPDGSYAWTKVRSFD